MAAGTTGLTQAVAGGIAAIEQETPSASETAQASEQFVISPQFPQVASAEESPNLSLQGEQGELPSEIISDANEYIKIPVDAEKLQDYILKMRI